MAAAQTPPAGNFYVETKLEDRRLGLVRATSLGAGIAGDVTPDTASARIDAMAGTPGAVALTELRKRLEAASPPAGMRLEIEQAGLSLIVLARADPAHREGNALVALAQVLEAELPPGGARDLLAFARVPGPDLHGAVPTMIRAVEGGKTRLYLNVRPSPRLFAKVREFNERTGASLESGEDTRRP